MTPSERGIASLQGVAIHEGWEWPEGMDCRVGWRLLAMTVGKVHNFIVMPGYYNVIASPQGVAIHGRGSGLRALDCRVGSRLLAMTVGKVHNFIVTPGDHNVIDAYPPQRHCEPEGIGVEA